MLEDKHDPVRQFLSSYWELRKEQARMEQKIEELEAQCQSITAKIRATPGCGGGRNNDLWDTLVEARSRAGKKLADTMQRSEEIEQFVDGLTEEAIGEYLTGKERMMLPKYRILLKYRYLEFLDWQPIAKLMGYELRHIYRIHGQALEACRLRWRQLHQDEEATCL